MYDVAVVMPVYNEAECICDVLDDWIKELTSLKITYHLIVLNDGSKDTTADVLERYAGNPAVMIINKKNSGHGPTILQGYGIAVQDAQWVFQVDSDNEIQAEQFKKLWTEREKYAVVIGVRDGRQQPFSRKIISMVSCLVVRVFYGRGVTDVNCPFRLMRADILKQILQNIPSNTFAPNVAISGYFALGKVRLLNQSILHTNRQTGEVSIKKWKLLKAAAKSLLQTIQIRFGNSGD